MRTGWLKPFLGLPLLAAVILWGAASIPGSEAQATATPDPARFDGQWTWRKVRLDAPCGSVSIKTFEIRDGRVEGSGHHPVGGSIRLQGTVDPDGATTIHGSANGHKVLFTGRFTETEGKGQAEVSGVAVCSGTWKAKKQGAE
jgi:hypothetical protein